MNMKKSQPLPNGAKKTKASPIPPTSVIGKNGIKIITPGNGKGPFSSLGTKVIDLETGNEIEGVREIHIHIVRDDVVTAELVVMLSELIVKGAKAKISEVPKTELEDVL